MVIAHVPSLCWKLAGTGDKAGNGGGQGGGTVLKWRKQTLAESKH